MQHYEIVQLIGKGSYGKVFTARNYEDHELYVLKRVPFDDATKIDADAALREAQTLACLRHPHIVPYREFFHFEGDLCLVMAFAEGGDLYAHVKALRKAGKTLDEEQAWKWIVQCLLALSYCHSKKILHRDVKTQNIFLTKDLKVMLGDFGLAKSLQHTLEMAKTPIGTPFYMAPEIYEESPYSYKSDVWAMGCVFYEMLAGKPAFGGENLSRVVLKVLKGSYDPLPSCYSPELCSIIDSMLRKKVQKRPGVNELLSHPLIAAKVQDYLNELSGSQAGWSTWRMKIPTTILDQVAKLNLFTQPEASEEDFLASNEATILQKQIVDVRASRDAGGTDEAIKEEEEEEVEEEEDNDDDYHLPGHLERNDVGNESYDE